MLRLRITLGAKKMELEAPIRGLRQPTHESHEESYRSMVQKVCEFQFEAGAAAKGSLPLEISSRFISLPDPNPHKPNAVTVAVIIGCSSKAQYSLCCGVLASCGTSGGAVLSFIALPLAQPNGRPMISFGLLNAVEALPESLDRLINTTGRVDFFDPELAMMPEEYAVWHGRLELRGGKYYFRKAADFLPIGLAAETLCIKRLLKIVKAHLHLPYLRKCDMR